MLRVFNGRKEFDAECDVGELGDATPIVPGALTVVVICLAPVSAAPDMLFLCYLDVSKVCLARGMKACRAPPLWYDAEDCSKAVGDQTASACSSSASS